MPIQERPRLNRGTDGSGLPNVHGDRYRPADYLTDKAFLQGKIGDLAELSLLAPSIISGLVVSKGVGDTLTITAGSALLFDDQTPSIIAHDYDGAALAPTLTIPEYITAVAYAGVVDTAIASATLDGVAVNYVKFTVADESELQRGPSHDPGTPYDAFNIEGMTLTVDSTPPTSTELLLATFIGTGGGAFTFSSDPESSERAFPFGIKSANGKLYAPVTGLEVHKDGSIIKTTLTFNPTVDRTIAYPDNSGTLALLSDIGGAGSGFSPLVSGFNESPFQLISLTEFPVNKTHSGGNTLINSGDTTATEGGLTKKYVFDTAGQKVVTNDMVTTNFAGKAAQISRMVAALRWTSIADKQDPISRVRVTRNGGLSYVDVSAMRQLGLKEGSVDILTDYDSTNQDSTIAVNLTTQIQVAQGFQVTLDSVLHAATLNLKRVGDSKGRFRLSVRADDTSTPSLTVIYAITDWNDIADIDTTTFEDYRFNFIYQAYLTGATQYHLVLELEDIEEYDWVTTIDELQIGIDSSAPTYAGGQAYIGDGASFSGVAGTDLIFGIVGSGVLAEGVADISSGEVIFEAADHYSRNSDITVYDETNGDTSVELNATTQQQLAQQFKLDKQFAISQVLLRLLRTGTPGGQLEFSIYSDNAGVPGSLVATANNYIKADAVGLSEEYRTFKFTGGVELAAETLYWFVLDGINGYSFTAGNKIALRADSSAPTYLSGSGDMAIYNGAAWGALATNTAIFKLQGAYQDDSIVSIYDKAHESSSQLDIDDGTARERLAQSFQTEANAYVKSLELYLNRVGAPGGTCYVEVYDDNSGEPGSLLGTSDSRNIDDLPAVGTNIRFNFDINVPVTKTTDYWMVLRTTGYTYTDTIDELQWFRDPTSPVHSASGSSQYASSAWTPFTGQTHVYTVFGVEAELFMEVYGNKINSELTGLALWYVFQDAYITTDPNVSEVTLTATMKASGAVPYGGMSVEPGRGNLVANLSNNMLSGGIHFIESENTAHFDPSDLAAPDSVVFHKLRQSQNYTSPVLELQDRLRSLPIPVISRFDAETIEFTSRGGAGQFKAELPDGTVLIAQSGLRTSFNIAKNQLGGLGLDTGVEAIDTEYYLYAVKRAGTTRDLAMVISATKPSAGGPTGYRLWNYVCRFWNDASGDIIYPIHDSVSLTGTNGNGSTNTQIVRFKTTERIAGSRLTYNSDATNGDSVTVNTSGVYACSYSASLNSAQTTRSLKVGSSLLNNTLDAHTKAGSRSNFSGSDPDSISWMGYIQAGDLVYFVASATLFDAVWTRFDVQAIDKLDWI